MKGIGEGKEGNQNFSFTGISLIISIIFITGTMFIVSCTKTYEFTIGKDFFDSQTRLQVIDTFRVELSTILLDSIRTSNTKKILAGNYKDDIFGSVKCESYFDLAYKAFTDIEEKAVFDSSVFILPYNGYTYGDTTSLMSLSIHKLTEKITLSDDNYLYNNRTFSYSPEAVGTISFYPEPNSTDTSISININTLGEELFNYIKNKDENVSSEVWFSDYLKGFILTPGTVENNAVIGFDAAEKKIELKIYYHIDNLEPEKKEISISMGASNHQFNSVRYDLTNTSLSSIKMEGNEMPSSETDYKGYMQGMTGLLPKIQFPTLGDILEQERWKILKAELVIEPVKSSYDLFRLPEKLYIYDTDKGNRINSVLTDNKNRALTASFEFDELYGRDTRYIYDITSFINAELSGADFDYEHGLLIGLELEEFKSSLDRLLIEGKKPPVKLKLYYLSY
jgi:hypothetical protein